LTGNEVKIDETYIGGKNNVLDAAAGWRPKDKKVENAQGRSLKDKTPVLGMIERGGELTAVVVENTTSQTLA